MNDAHSIQMVLNKSHLMFVLLFSASLSQRLAFAAAASSLGGNEDGTDWALGQPPASNYPAPRLKERYTPLTTRPFTASGYLVFYLAFSLPHLRATFTTQQSSAHRHTTNKQTKQ